MNKPTDPKNLTPSPHNWPYLAQVAVQYGVDPQAVLDTAIGQVHYLIDAVGEECWRREMAVSRFGAQVDAGLMTKLYWEAFENAAD